MIDEKAGFRMSPIKAARCARMTRQATMFDDLSSTISPLSLKPEALKLEGLNSGALRAEPF